MKGAMSKFYTVDEVAELIDIPADTIREWITDGKVSASRRAGDVVLRHHEVQRLISELGRDAIPEQLDEPAAANNVVSQGNSTSGGSMTGMNSVRESAAAGSSEGMAVPGQGSNQVHGVNRKAGKVGYSNGGSMVESVPSGVPQQVSETVPGGGGLADYYGFIAPPQAPHKPSSMQAPHASSPLKPSKAAMPPQAPSAPAPMAAPQESFAPPVPPMSGQAAVRERREKVLAAPTGKLTAPASKQVAPASKQAVSGNREASFEGEQDGAEAPAAPYASNVAPTPASAGSAAAGNVGDDGNSISERTPVGEVATSDSVASAQSVATSSGLKIQSGIALNHNVVPIAIDYNSLYDNELDEYESRLRYDDMELPLPASSSDSFFSEHKDGAETHQSGAGLAIGGRGSSSGDSASFEQTLQRVVEPLARAQARLIKLFNDYREGRQETSGSVSAPERSLEAVITRLEDKIGSIGASTPSDGDSRALRIFVEAGLGEVRKELASLRTLCIERFNAVDNDLSVGGSTAKLKESLESILSAVNSLGKGSLASAEGADLSALQKKCELLERKYKNLRSEHEQVLSENSRASVQTANADSVLDRLEVLRAPLDAYSLEAGEFAEKIVTYIESLSAGKQKAEDKYAECKAQYEACEEESSTFQLLIDSLQKENHQLKEDCDKLREGQVSKDSSQDGELQKLRETCEQLRKVSSGSNVELLKLQEQLAAIEAEKASLEHKLEESNALCVELQKQSQTQELEEQNKSLSERLDESQAELNSARSDLEEAKNLLEEAKTEIEDTRIQLDHSNTAYSDLSAAYRKKESEAEQAQAELVHMQTVAKSAEVQAAELESMITEAHQETLEVSEALKKAEEQLKEADAKLEGYEKELNEAHKEHDKLQAELAKDREEGEKRAATAKAEYDNALASIRTELGKAKQEAQDSAAEIQAHKEATAQKEQEMQELAARAEAEKVRLMRRINTLQAKNEALQAEIEEQQEFSGNDAARAVELRMQDQLDAVNFELSEAKAQLREYKQRLQSIGDGDALGADLREALDRIDNLQAENDSLRYELSLHSGEDIQGQSAELMAALANLEEEGAEKDRLIQEAHQDRTRLREDLERTKQALFEQQQLYERERKEWSEILAKQVKGEAVTTSGSSADSSRRGGFRLFRNRGGNV